MKESQKIYKSCKIENITFYTCECRCKQRKEKILSVMCKTGTNKSFEYWQDKIDNNK